MSQFVGAGTLKRMVKSAGLPLEVDDDIRSDQLQDPGKVQGATEHTTITLVGHFE